MSLDVAELLRRAKVRIISDRTVRVIAVPGNDEVSARHVIAACDPTVELVVVGARHTHVDGCCAQCGRRQGELTP